MYFVQPVLSRNLSHNWINPVKQQLAHFNGDSPLYHFLLLLRSAYDTYERVVPLDDCGAICIPLEWVEYMNACDGSDDEWLSYSIQEEVTLIISKTNVLLQRIIQPACDCICRCWMSTCARRFQIITYLLSLGRGVQCFSASTNIIRALPRRIFPSHPCHICSMCAPQWVLRKVLFLPQRRWLRRSHLGRMLGTPDSILVTQ